MTLPASVGRYSVQGELGRGAMGVLFRAFDPALERPVAVKVIAPGVAETVGVDSSVEARFLREARVAARISHPNVVAVHDAGRDGNSLYLVMELVEGEPLAARLLRGEFPPAHEALELTAQVADALGAAHALGVVHRDVKPGNIMITRSGRVKVADFGVAKAIGEETDLTRSGTVIGSPAYMAPEQVRGQSLDGRADLFSLGVVLYELLMRRKPFPADTVTSLIYQILHEDPLADPAVSSILGAEVASFLRRCLEKAPEKRIPDAGSFAAEARALAAAVAPDNSVATAPTAAIATGPVHSPARVRLFWLGLAAVVGVLAVWGAISARHGSRPAAPEPAPAPPETPEVSAPARVAAVSAASSRRPAASPRPAKTSVPPVPTAAVGAEPTTRPAALAQPTAPEIVAIFYCSSGVEFDVTPPEALVTVDGAPIGRADNGDHARSDAEYRFPSPGRHYLKLSAPGYRTTWVAVVVDPRAEDEIAEIDTRLPPQ